MSSGLSGYLVLAGVTAAGVLLFVAAMFARRLLAPRAPSQAKASTYESGVDPVAGGWAQTHVRYMTFAFLYLVFAVDSVFLFPWALVLRNKSINHASLLEMGIFAAVILVGLAHAARRGLLRWTLDN
ncbi:NADH-quinone oxidoreductase subunit A [Allobranchiibius sp. CTAmp26]|uniref:NADH-quinone oxidoreductase subunit A n=1 Tax=Allobranchiibius sp. CTAmp26 TaxID=2815214 RepID=UPI0027DD15CB|nr:NADH-quinone oxidoreductase subunit A [Allobranchiibius sp. CTAmp26]